MEYGIIIRNIKVLVFIIIIKIIQGHLKEENVGMGFITIIMEMFMKENGIMILGMEEVDSLIFMEIFIKGNGLIIKNMVLANTQILMDQFIMVVFIMVTKKENVRFYFKMVEDCKEIGIR